MSETEKTEEELLASIMQQTEMLTDEDLPPVPEPDQEEVEEVEEDVDESEEVEAEEPEDEEELEEEDDGDEESEEGDSEEPAELSEEEVDWDYKIPVKIDGEVQHLSLEEVRKGYATQQHLSNQGRELGEARKQIEEERTERLGQLENMAVAMDQILGQNEQYLAQQYHNIDQQINQARTEGDQYKVQELKDAREVAQQQYWQARNQRETVLGQAVQAKEQIETEQWNQKVQTFYDGITEVIPDYSEDYANDLRQFALDEGVDPDYLNGIVDPGIVALVDNYRKLKQGVSEGAKKRAKAPVKKAPVARKARTDKQKKASKENMVKARAFREDASKEDQDAFLKQYASRSLGIE